MCIIIEKIKRIIKYKHAEQYNSNGKKYQEQLLSLTIDNIINSKVRKIKTKYFHIVSRNNNKERAIQYRHYYSNNNHNNNIRNTIIKQYSNTHVK